MVVVRNGIMLAQAKVRPCLLLNTESLEIGLEVLHRFFRDWAYVLVPPIKNKTIFVKLEELWSFNTR